MSKKGIVPASDSRISFTSTSVNVDPNGTISVTTSGLHYTENTYKTFLCPNNAGISICGCASINNKPIAGFVEKFIRENVDSTTVINEIPQAILNHFRDMGLTSETTFFVAGYHNENDTLQQKLYVVKILANEIKTIDTSQQGAMWDGDYDILSRLIIPMFTKNGNDYHALPDYQIPWNHFTLQDAIDFAQSIIKTVINIMKFQVREKTIGGAIDVLAIKPDTTTWIDKKELHSSL